MTASTPQAEAFIAFRLQEMSSRNEHHRFEDIATRIARKRISANILIATGPVSSGGDQQRDAESYLTRISAELPSSAGFSSSVSQEQIVIACTIQKDKLKSKILADLAGICAPTADPVTHIAFFSVHSIPASVTHELKHHARENFGISLDVFSGPDIATLLAEPDLIWIARHYLDLPSSMEPPTVKDAEHPEQWYVELVDEYRRNNGPAELTPATQGEIVRGLRFATWNPQVNSDLPEWLDFMAAFLTPGSVHDELRFRACYEMAVARLRGMSADVEVEKLMDLACIYASTATKANVLEDATVLLSYWTGMWIGGYATETADEISTRIETLQTNVRAQLNSSNADTHPVRVASLLGTLAFSSLIPNCAKLQEQFGVPTPAQGASLVGIELDEKNVDISKFVGSESVDINPAMVSLASLIDVLPKARVYSIRQLANIFTMFAPILTKSPLYRKVREGLDQATGLTEGESARAALCRDRAMAQLKVGNKLEALMEFHEAKINWFNGAALYGSVLAMRMIAQIYDQLKLPVAAKMYSCAAATVALAHGDADVVTQVPKALLEASSYAHNAGLWADTAGLSELALLARGQYVSDPFNLEKHHELSNHLVRQGLELVAIRAFWPTLEPLLASCHEQTGWYDAVTDLIEGGEPEILKDEAAYQQSRGCDLSGPIFGDLGARRVYDFSALGVRWTFECENTRTAALTAEAFIAAFQVFLADVAIHHPVVIASTVRVEVEVLPDTSTADMSEITFDRSKAVIAANLRLSSDYSNMDVRNRSFVAISIKCLEAVHVRPWRDLEALIEPLIQAGLVHKISVGRPYEEVASLLDVEHYEKCAKAIRPESSREFSPKPAPGLEPSTELGQGYDRHKALERISERYEVARETLRLTMPRLKADSHAWAKIECLRTQGYLDWQILVVLLNIVWNWRMQQAGVDPRVRPSPQVVKMATAPETEDSDVVPVTAFTDEAIAVHTKMQCASVALMWDLRSRQEGADEEPLRELLVRRYRYNIDDVAHDELFAVTGE